MINPSSQHLTVSYLRAKSYTGLVRKMNLNNIKFKQSFNYSEVTSNNGYLYIYFNYVLENLDQLNEELEKANG